LEVFGGYSHRSVHNAAAVGQDSFRGAADLRPQEVQESRRVRLGRRRQLGLEAGGPDLVEPWVRRDRER
jgi:hypothetical protein